MSQMCSLSTSAVRDSVSTRVPPTQPTPIAADFDCLHAFRSLLDFLWTGRIKTMPERRPQLLNYDAALTPNTRAANCG